MPRDLFGDVAVRPPTRLRFRRLLTIASIVLHATVIVAVLVAQIFAVGPLPVPHRPMIFQLRAVALEIPVPPMARRVSLAPAPTVSPNAAPLEEPAGVTKETGLEGTRAAAVPSDAVVGVERGTSYLGALGAGENVAPPPPLPPATPIRLHAGMQAPVKTVHVNPVYPVIAQQARKEGVVILEAIIDVRGVVQSVTVLRSAPLLDQAAADAVKQWRYSPARLNGEAVPVIMTVTVNFTLDR